MNKSRKTGILALIIGIALVSAFTTCENKIMIELLKPFGVPEKGDTGKPVEKIYWWSWVSTQENNSYESTAKISFTPTPDNSGYDVSVTGTANATDHNWAAQVGCDYTAAAGKQYKVTWKWKANNKLFKNVSIRYVQDDYNNPEVDYDDSKYQLGTDENKLTIPVIEETKTYYFTVPGNCFMNFTFQVGADTGSFTIRDFKIEEVAAICTVTFNANGGTGTLPASQTVSAGTSITLPGGSGLTRTGYTFGSWNTNQAGTGTNYAAGASYTVNSSVTLYAKWNPTTSGPTTITLKYTEGTWEGEGFKNYEYFYDIPSSVTGGKITEGDVYKFTYTFTSNVALTDKLRINLVDHDDRYTELSGLEEIGTVSADTTVSGEKTLTAIGTASSTAAEANQLRFVVFNASDEAHEPTLTFTEFTLTKNGSGGSTDSTFNSITEFETWLNAQPYNNADEPYNVKLDSVNDLGGNVNSIGSVGNLIQTNSDKYINLDLSGSNFASIGETAFYGCTNLTGITIPDSVESIGSSAFENCTSLTSVTIPNTVATIEGAAFAKTGLTSITIPDSVESIKESAFTDCTSLTSVTIGNKVKNIGSSAFYGCTSLASITIPNSVITIGDYTFTGCTSLTSITIGSGVESIGGYALVGTGLTSVTIPNKVTSIGIYAFAECKSLISVTFQGAGTLVITSYITFPGDLGDKYAADGIGTYTRPNGGSEWTKQN